MPPIFVQISSTLQSLGDSDKKDYFSRTMNERWQTRAESWAEFTLSKVSVNEMMDADWL